MTIQEAMKARHTVRQFTEKKLSQQTVRALSARMQENNEKYRLKMKLVTENAEAIPGLIRLMLAKGVKNYIVLSANDFEHADEGLGYCGADMMLFAQTLGLNSWWIGGTFSKKAVRKTAGLSNEDLLTGIIALGYGQTQGRPHKSKKATDISVYDGDAPDWFVRGTEAVLLAPTALNRQSFSIRGAGNRVKMTSSNGHFAGTDLGIGKYHFELGAGKKNFEWQE